MRWLTIPVAVPDDSTAIVGMTGAVGGGELISILVFSPAMIRALATVVSSTLETLAEKDVAETDSERALAAQLSAELTQWQRALTALSQPVDLRAVPMAQPVNQRTVN